VHAITRALPAVQFQCTEKRSIKTDAEQSACITRFENRLIADNPRILVLGAFHFEMLRIGAEKQLEMRVLDKSIRFRLIADRRIGFGIRR
jgi:hypothetical protein